MINHLVSIEIEGTVYTKDTLRSMSFDELKMLASFVENESKLRKIADWSNNIQFILYVDSLYNKAFPISEVNSITISGVLYTKEQLNKLSYYEKLKLADSLNTHEQVAKFCDMVDDIRVRQHAKAGM